MCPGMLKPLKIKIQQTLRILMELTIEQASEKRVLPHIKRANLKMLSVCIGPRSCVSRFPIRTLTTISRVIRQYLLIKQVAHYLKPILADPEENKPSGLVPDA